ncbi:MAG: hypothetical protein F2667_01610 [Actinobacteria bacterium]|uniref:Unannotated protein n=1 Tax=freshwater metagenome TaxID=449393 RepID=A0A6J6NX38_9ZZZZ|nr:hypothetical protein [Actinomycetota bacterium]
MKNLRQSPDTHQVVLDAIRRLDDAFRDRDVDAAVACFSPEGAFYGDDLVEHAHGADDLRSFLAEMFEEAYTIGWDVRDTWARRHGDVLWFVAEVRAVMSYEVGLMEHVPFRISGILRRHRGQWRFELFDGTQPADATRELLVTA